MSIFWLGIDFSLIIYILQSKLKRVIDNKSSLQHVKTNNVMQQWFVSLSLHVQNIFKSPMFSHHSPHWRSQQSFDMRH